MTTRLSRTLVVLGRAASLLVSFQACSSEPHTAKTPLAENKIAAPPCDQPSDRQPTTRCQPCLVMTLPEPAMSAERTPVPCTADTDCSSRFCDRGVCGALRTGNFDNGLACTADRHCKSGLCDRGFCTSIGGMLNAGHGEPCEPLPPFEQRNPKHDHRRDQQCGGYLCLDGRCRSCTSDSECIYWEGGGTCDYTPGLPGKRCGNHKPLDPDGPYKTPPPLSPSRLPSGAVPTLPPAGS